MTETNKQTHTQTRTDHNSSHHYQGRSK